MPKAYGANDSSAPKTICSNGILGINTKFLSVSAQIKSYNNLKWC